MNDPLFRELVSGSVGTYTRPGQQSLAVPWVADEAGEQPTSETRSSHD